MESEFFQGVCVGMVIACIIMYVWARMLLKLERQHPKMKQELPTKQECEEVAFDDDCPKCGDGMVFHHESKTGSLYECASCDFTRMEI